MVAMWKNNKSSPSAPLTINQRKGFPTLMEKGGVVVGQGKGVFPKGKEIPEGTNVEIVRPKK